MTAKDDEMDGCWEFVVYLAVLVCALLIQAARLDIANREIKRLKEASGQ